MSEFVEMHYYFTDYSNVHNIFWIFVILKLHILFGYCVDENGVGFPWSTNKEPLFSFMHGRS